jgi:hypothetical protein
VCDLGEAREASEDPRDPRLRERSAGLRCSALPHRAEQRSRSFAAHDEPRLQLGPRLGNVGAALLLALAHHAERPGGAVEIREIEGGELGAAETRDAEHTEQGEIARTAGRCRGAGAEQGDELGPLDMPARRETRTPHPLDVGDQGVRLGRQEAEAHRFAGDPAHCTQDLVRGRRGEVFGESTSEGGDMGILERTPADRVRVGRAELDGD